MAAPLDDPTPTDPTPNSPTPADPARMHTFRNDDEVLAQSIMGYALERIRHLPSLDGPQTSDELHRAAGISITPDGLGGSEALRSNHIRTLRSQGLSNVTISIHALRGAMLPVVSYMGPAAAALLTGSVVIETIFGLPGVGRYFVEGALNRDYTLVMGTVVMVAVFVLLFNLIVDILYALLDPRVRYDT